MNLRNPSRSPSRHQEDLAYRRARLQRSLVRLRTHPAVNPTGPHGPHGCLTSSASVASSCPIYPKPIPSTLNPSRRNTTQPQHHVPPGIIPALFNDLVHRELGLRPSNNLPNNSARLTEYLSAARAVTSTPSLSNPTFLARLATGNDPSRLTDRELLSSLISKPIGVTLQSRQVRDIHLAIQKAHLKRRDATAKINATNTPDSTTLRRSTRKRLRSQMETLPQSKEETTEMGRISNRHSGELAPFRPSPESVRRTRSEAARARRPSSSKALSECCFCPDPQKFEGKEIKSELIGPFVDRRGNAKLFVHFDCACWAPQVYTDPANGQLRRVYDEYCRGRKLKCSSCGEKGATIGCYIQRCKRVFHYRCLEPAKAYCVERFFAAFCATHAHLGRKPSYKILMEAATIADVSAAQRREDTTYGLDAPHSRYTMLRRRETEIIFSRRWRIASHTGAFDTRKVVFSHRRKVVLGKYDRISVGDCVRVLRTSTLDIASGRLAFMALAQKDEASECVTAVEARAAIASRESTGLLLLRNLRNARQWGTDEIEVIRGIPMESKPSQDPSMGRVDPDGKHQITTKERKNGPKEYSFATLSGQKRAALQEERGMAQDSSLKRHKVSGDNGVSNDAESGAAKRDRVASARLPSFDRCTRRHDMHRTSEVRNVSEPLKQAASDKDASEDPSGQAETRLEQEDDNRQSPTASNSKADASAPGPSTASPGPTYQKDGFPEQSQSTPQHVVNDGCNKQEDCEKGEAGVKVKSTWETFLEEQLPRERLLRPDDSHADSLRNMARLWSLMTPAQRDAYERRGRVSGISAVYQGSQAKCVAALRTASSTKRGAGLFANAESSHMRTQSGLKGQTKLKERVFKRQPSVSLSVVKDIRRDGRVVSPQNDQPNWDDLFPTTLESDPRRIGEGDSAQYEGGQMVARVRTPPTRAKAG